MLKAMADNGVNITTQEDAAMYDAMAGFTDGVLEKIANKMTCTYNGLIVTLGTGGCVLQGRHVYETDGSTKVTVGANTSGYIMIRYDTSEVSGNEASFVSSSEIMDDDLNNDGIVRDLKLYQYTADASGITSFKDVRTWYEGGGYTLPKATATVLGGVRMSYGATLPATGQEGDIFLMV